MTSSISRRALIGAGAALPVVAGLGACTADPGGSGSGGGGGGGDTSLRLSWWGNPTRDENTRQAIELYTERNSGVTIEGEAGDFDSYWDRLATQTAGSATPDVLQMDLRYIREYGDRGVLLDLEAAGLDSAAFAPGTVDAGRGPAGLMGINGGVNAAAIMANPAVFEAAGVDLPDDQTWTWEDLAETAKAITDGTNGEVAGAATSVGGIAALEFWVRQKGKSMYTEEGLGFDVDDMTDLFEWLKSLVVDGGTPSPAAITEDDTKPLAQKLFATGNLAMAAYWSNQVNALDTATGEDLILLRYPSMAADVAETKYWYKASMLWSASADSDPEAVVSLIDFIVNDPDCAAILKAERGMPANLDMREAIRPDFSASDQKASDFLDLLESSISDTPIAPPPGSSAVDDALSRFTTDFVFDNLSPSEAAEQFVAEAKGHVNR